MARVKEDVSKAEKVSWTAVQRLVPGAYPCEEFENMGEHVVHVDPAGDPDVDKLDVLMDVFGFVGGQKLNAGVIEYTKPRSDRGEEWSIAPSILLAVEGVELALYRRDASKFRVGVDSVSFEHETGHVSANVHVLPSRHRPDDIEVGTEMQLSYERGNANAVAKRDDGSCEEITGVRNLTKRPL